MTGNAFADHSLDEVCGPQTMNKTYAYYKVGPMGRVAVGNLREQFSKLHNFIEAICPKSRERSVALTSLETAAMWAIKAVVANDPESEAMM